MEPTPRDNPTPAETAQPRKPSPARKPYSRPAIVAELPLETRAGSPLNLLDPNGEPNEYGL